jgi:hypothetical protein
MSGRYCLRWYELAGFFLEVRYVAATVGRGLMFESKIAGGSGPW